MKAPKADPLIQYLDQVKFVLDTQFPLRGTVEHSDLFKVIEVSIDVVQDPYRFASVSSRARPVNQPYLGLFDEIVKLGSTRLADGSIVSVQLNKVYRNPPQRPMSVGMNTSKVAGLFGTSSELPKEAVFFRGLLRLAIAARSRRENFDPCDDEHKGRIGAGYVFATISCIGSLGACFVSFGVACPFSMVGCAYGLYKSSNDAKDFYDRCKPEPPKPNPSQCCARANNCSNWNSPYVCGKKTAKCVDDSAYSCHCECG